MDDSAIKAGGLRKAFGPVRALDGLSFRVPAGTLLGLLGPNGSGKTTTVSILSTALQPDGGHATVHGLDVTRRASAVRQLAGFAGQYAAVDPNLTGRENLALIARLSRVGRKQPRVREGNPIMTSSAPGATPARRVDRDKLRRRARIMRVMNVGVRAALRLPFPTPLSANLMLISYTGVKSGKAYLQPVSYARDGQALLTPGGGRWTRNLGGHRPVRLVLGGRSVPARADLVADPAEVERLLGVIAADNPRAMKFIPIPRRPDGRLDPDALDAALAHGFRIVRWHLGQPG